MYVQCSCMSQLLSNTDNYGICVCMYVCVCVAAPVAHIFYNSNNNDSNSRSSNSSRRSGENCHAVIISIIQLTSAEKITHFYYTHVPVFFTQVQSHKLTSFHYGLNNTRT